ncbi:MliC family protein [Cypionkella sp.]|uniref:MliC family protein n=1 Tax=Cypionkella sp. TaxID=2811411 RepID=UPI002ABA5DDD|nr:MliC family protein [Cypionkella sp.]MDZ4393727.1 MliC family protein [Cypionkella sp.]
MIRKFAVLALLAACTPEAPAPSADGTEYLCADGTKLAAAYSTEGEDSSVKLTIKGETFTLLSEPAASGARYGWPSDGSNYVWWTKGDSGTLYWKDGTKGGAETVLHADCKPQ